ncbi:YshB family small membrane protein [Edwardsiella ictaluri]|nr:YshB family small membrane protein [Edwardsiella ictaluri]UCQ47763.1 YshB family small membrane protein [Edwardsiella ictaluri]UCQ51026.1 YshB family small membrane protein [Edwardsiella ictaluri]UYB61680.1 YshB family small membrane protein [Edwardsiella ictaluri]UYB64905.1 YshB family small membrane protein [Edwardsiella ictaluri]WFN97646.1 YshB family small membrane protein [Edwardsiella ictaluri]
MMIDSLCAMVSHGTGLNASGGPPSHASIAAVLCVAQLHLLG